jgi:hypothetical protein
LLRRTQVGGTLRFKILNLFEPARNTGERPSARTRRWKAALSHAQVTAAH